LAARLWIDVEDLFEYVRSNRRPSGIQRLAFEIYQTMQARYGDTGLVQFVRHDIRRNSFRVVPWHEVTGLFEKLTEMEVLPSTRLEDGISPHPPARQLMRRLVHRLTPSLRPALVDAALTLSEALRAWGRLAGEVRHGARSRLKRFTLRIRSLVADRRERAGATEPASFAECATSGDVVLALGAPWSHPDYPGLIRMQRERGLRFALLVYDLIPIRRPEWFERGLVRLFRAKFESTLPLCDVVFAISQATAADVEAYARENGIALRGPVTPIPIGTGFGSHSPPARTSHCRGLPSAASYVLFVSTIEARKNHTLLFRVWRRLLEDLPAERVPTLVFAGHIGWLVDDLMRQIASTDHLNGKLVVIEDPTDTELTMLYRGCLFTVFPSFHEGWGLPVTESLAFGKPCVISNRTSLPEAGGRLVRSFDPDNLHDAYAVIRQVIDDRPGLARWEAEVRREFKPVSWSATVDALLTGLEHPLVGLAFTSRIGPAVRVDSVGLASESAVVTTEG
jgi:glycosyltransferase involved in cell wall biosynthesis